MQIHDLYMPLVSIYHEQVESRQKKSRKNLKKPKRSKIRLLDRSPKRQLRAKPWHAKRHSPARQTTGPCSRALGQTTRLTRRMTRPAAAPLLQTTDPPI